MPTPLQIALDPASLVVFAIYAGLLLLEFRFPARQLPKIDSWFARGIGSFIVYFYLSSYLPLFFTAQLSEVQLWDLSGLGDFGGAILGILAYELCVWGWHRSMHKVNFLWRIFHQFHHSAERVDAAGAFYFSIFDMIGWTVLFSVSLTLIGVTPKAAIYANWIATFLAIFQHLNVRTPIWAGYIVQRPESHSVHHEKGVHGFNYSDLPVFDLIFGTFKNPPEFAKTTGFYEGASSRIIDMHLFKDVSQPN
jgi:sterol desaturase/sphingolipid hydroxylase (fatty acid hydroxylase superfamily)